MSEQPIDIQVTGPGVKYLSRANEHDAGFDLASMVDIEIAPGEKALIDTGVSLALPPGMCAFLMSRSGLSSRLELILLNGVGLIDSGYRGQLMASAKNLSDETVSISQGQRIAQLVIQKLPTINLVEVAELEPSEDDRAGGFGSTGV